ncbi:cell traversal protein for ookinetes and sporozoites, putative [Plasmodium malariae]|uniref:Cell traversal protein for ookinetes and sporozoites, putative n=1 Tax=Plasmodium malariae TaxID=5858 RepID=A0A1C3L2Z5_PLAMA|nr:cell traversal protein for ookinetes and sporozoites, putative [Plasmodium malariae]
MNKVQRLSIISSLLVFLCFVNVLCLRNKNGTSASSSLENGSEFSERLNKSFSSFISESASVEEIGNEIADNIANEIISALQKDSVSFLQSGFDIKRQLKENAKVVLKEVLKQGLEPLENIVADAVKPPHTNPQVYHLLSPVLKTLFNRMERAVHVNVPDAIWDYETEEPYEGEEVEGQYSDDFFN